MSRFGYCTPCYLVGRESEAVVIIDGDPLCATCVRSLNMKPEAPVRLSPEPKARAVVEACRRGCGKPTHRGLCRGQVIAKPAAPVVRLPAAVPVAELAIETVLGKGWNLEDVEDTSAKAELKNSAKESRMDVLQAEEIDIASVPRLEPQRALIGRLGELWSRFSELPEGQVLKVTNRSTAHAGSTLRSVIKRAKAHQKQVYALRVGTMLYLARTEFQGARRG